MRLPIRTTWLRASLPGAGGAERAIIPVPMATDKAPPERPVLDFERPVVELERKIEELRMFAGGSAELQREIQTLQARVHELHQEIFADLSPWQKVLLSRHPGRPYTLDFIARLLTEFVE